MGCASSKQSRCRHCQSPYSPLARSYSMPVHHPAERKGDSYHVVALTSTTLGSLKLDSMEPSHPNSNCVSDDEAEDLRNPIKISTNNYINSNDSKSREFAMKVNQGRSWSDMINEKIPKIIPKTPIRTPPGEPETINTWEMMEGLDDCSPLRLPNLFDRSFSFHAIPNSTSFDQPKQKLQGSNTGSPILDQPKLKLQENGIGSPRPMWIHMMNDDSNSNLGISDFDSEMVSTFRKALEELSPMNTALLRSPENEKTVSPVDNHLSSKDVDTKKLDKIIIPTNCPPRGEDKVVVYFTSLRGVRKTYEDCCHVRVILKGCGVRVDERDVSMHHGYREELRELLGYGFGGGLPRVFVRGGYIGGAEEIRQMHEDGELEKFLEGCAVVEDGGGGGGGAVCEVCGDIRFVLCERCSGSCKIYSEEGEEWEGEEENEVEEGGGFQRCPDCNENGIILCPVCCY